MTGQRRRPRGGGEGPTPGAAATRRSRGGREGSGADGFSAGGAGRKGGDVATEDADPASLARSIALRQLTSGPRTRAQLAAAMKKRDVPAEVIESVLDRFEDVSLVDDEEFARQWVTSRHVGRGLARRALSYELRQRGVADDVVRDAVDELSPEDELAAARELVRKRAPAMRSDDPARRTRRLAGMLARKGYSGAVAMRAVREELNDAADDAFVVDDD